MAGQIVAKNCGVLLRGRKLSTDLNSTTISRNAEAPEATCYEVGTRSRLEAGIKDWSVALAGFFDDQTGAAEERAHTLLAGSTILGVFPAGLTTACEVGFEGECVEPDYSVEAPVEGVVTLSSTWSGSGDLHRTHILKLHSACATAGSAAAASRDFSASAAAVFGVVRCTTASGTTPTLDVIIQESNNDSTWSDLLTFTQITAGSVAEIKSGTSASRYLRAKWTIAGTGADFEFMVTAGQN